MEFMKHLADQPLIDHQRRAVTFDSIVDHEQAYSVYFSDPYGHCLELTTYDYEATRAALTQFRDCAR
jgi:hypothetical protein